VKREKSVTISLSYWAIGLTLASLFASQLTVGYAQTARPKIIIMGAHSTFERALSRPTEFLQAMGITSEEAQKELKHRPRILVVGAGFTRNVRLAAFTDTKPAKSSIYVEGAGAARVLGLSAFTEDPNPQLSKPAIHVAGAGSVRDIGLVTLPAQS
jgi:hypothetical protein